MKRQFFCAAAASWALALGAANAAGPSGNYGSLDSYSYVENAGYSCNERSATSYVQPASYLDDECEQYGGWCERFYTGIKETFKRCSLKKYKRAQRLHRGRRTGSVRVGHAGAPESWAMPTRRTSAMTKMRPMKA